MKAMILAAGRGMRMGVLSNTTPKPLLKIRDKALIEIQLNKLIEAGFNDFLINVSYLYEQIIDFVTTKFENKVSLTFSIETEPLETAGGIINALDFFDDNPFLVTNSDIFTDFKYEEIIKYQLKNGMMAHLIFVPNPNFKDQGDFGLANEFVNLNKDYTFSGIGIYTKQMFTEYVKGEKIQLKTVLENNIKKNRITGSLFKGYWSDVGTPERLKYENTKYEN
jgi:MurNAc alpha-1-phosphate uridylyltransferase